MALVYIGSSSRVKIIDEKVEYLKGMTSTLSDDLRHAHSIRLERFIIALIAVEVVFGISDHWHILAELTTGYFGGR